MTNLTPAWLNKEFFLNVLKKCENTTNVDLINLNLVPASGKDEHYASILFRATVEYHAQQVLKKKSLIIKAATEEEGVKKELFKETRIFETEIDMYSRVIPKFQAMLTQAGDETKLGPSCLYYDLTPNKVIVFEDLKDLGYEGLNKRATNYEETKAIYSKIAKWHALSYKLNLEQHDFFKFFEHDILAPMNVKEVPAFNDGIINFIELLDSQADLAPYKSYFTTKIGKMLSYWEKITVEYLKDRQSTAAYVLCHGDFHHMNLMFKRNALNESLEDLLFIDFQMCHMGTMVEDILNSIYMIMDAEQRLKNLDELLFYYFETFQNTLLKLGYVGEMPKMLQFRKELMRHKDFELFLLSSSLPIIMAMEKGKYTIGELMAQADARKIAYKDPDYIEHVRKMLLKYRYMGYLEN